MKLARITSAYPAYLERFYLRNPEASVMTYRDQKATLEHDAFGWADFWSTAPGASWLQCPGVDPECGPTATGMGQERMDRPFMARIYE